MTVEQIGVLFGAILAGIGAILGGYGYYIRSQGKALVLRAEAEKTTRETQAKKELTAIEIDKLETDTESEAVRSVTETLKNEREERQDLRRQLSKAYDERDTYNLNWQNTLTMLAQRNERVTELESKIQKLEVDKDTLQAKLEFCLDRNKNALDDFFDDGTQPIDKGK